MVRLLANGDSRFDVSPVEVERSGLSFTVDTLTHFATEYPTAERFLLLGADVMATFAHWREPRRVLELATPVVLARSDEGGGPTWTLPNGVDDARICRLPTRRVDVSSTEVRERARTGKTLRGFVTDDVAAYIERTRLYR
jgi:nicotinate-nucleotide adenylyltransferase